MQTAQGDIAVIGLAVMGQNLILNMNDHGFTVVAYNRTTAKVDEFLAHEAKGTKIIGARSVQEMVSLLKRPRRVMLMVKAGAAVDEFIEQLLPHLEPGTTTAGWRASCSSILATQAARSATVWVSAVQACRPPKLFTPPTTALIEGIQT